MPSIHSFRAIWQVGLVPSLSSESVSHITAVLSLEIHKLVLHAFDFIIQQPLLFHQELFLKGHCARLLLAATGPAAAAEE